MMLTVDIGEMAALEPIGVDPQSGVNQCAAQYYGVRSLTAESRIRMAEKSP
jgi:hypothetical protein